MTEHTSVPLSLARNVPDEKVLLCPERESARGALRQVQELIGDEHWVYSWTALRVERDGPGYELKRYKANANALQTKRESEALDRLVTLSQLASDDGKDWRKVWNSDPDLGNFVRQPMHRSWIRLTASLSAGQLRSVLTGRSHEVPIAALTPQQRNWAREAIGKSAMVVGTNGDGSRHVLFDSNQLDTGRLVFSRSQGASGKSGDLGIRIKVYSGGAATGKYGAGGEVLYPERQPEYRGERATARQRSIEASDRDPRARRSVTISRDSRRQGSEPWLATYLREWSKQTGYALVGWWPDVVEGREVRLPKSIVSRPSFEALSLLLEEYQCGWEKDGGWVRVRALNHSPGAASGSAGKIQGGAPK